MNEALTLFRYNTLHSKKSYVPYNKPWRPITSLSCSHSQTTLAIHRSDPYYVRLFSRSQTRVFIPPKTSKKTSIYSTPTTKRARSLNAQKISISITKCALLLLLLICKNLLIKILVSKQCHKK